MSYQALSKRLQGTPADAGSASDVAGLTSSLRRGEGPLSRVSFLLLLRDVSTSSLCSVQRRSTSNKIPQGKSNKGKHIMKQHKWVCLCSRLLHPAPTTLHDTHVDRRVDTILSRHEMHLLIVVTNTHTESHHNNTTIKYFSHISQTIFFSENINQPITRSEH